MWGMGGGAGRPWGRTHYSLLFTHLPQQVEVRRGLGSACWASGKARL